MSKEKNGFQQFVEMHTQWYNELLLKENKSAIEMHTYQFIEVHIRDVLIEARLNHIRMIEKQEADMIRAEREAHAVNGEL